jgi:hypothetical protein
VGAAVFAAGGLLALAHRSLGQDPAPTAGPWSLVASLAIVAGLLRVLLGGPRDEASVLRAWDREGAGGGLFGAARLALAGGAPGRLGDLVLAAADRSAAAPGFPPRGPHEEPLALRLAHIVALAGLLLVFAAPEGRLRPGPIGGSAEGRFPEGAPIPEPEDPGTPPSDPIRLEIEVEPRISHEGSLLTLLLATHVLVLDPPEGAWAFHLGVANGDLAPDRGLGPGWHVLDLGLERSVDGPRGSVHRDLLDLRTLLQQHGLHRPGLLTLVAVARASGARLEVRSAELTIQISDNVERARAPVPASARPAGGRAEATPRPEPEPPRTGPGGRGSPGTGDSDRLPEARRHPVAVRPLLGEGPDTEKEVSVFETAEGEGRVPGSSRPARPLPPASYAKVLEEAIPSFPLGAKDRDLVARYAEALRRAR